jgi:TRAP-type mannitol/chloroaromatic compound transport system substrate-binding protein
MMPIGGNVLAENGVSVAFISGTEIVSSMERGVLDAGEYGGPAVDRTFGFQDIAKYVAQPGFHQPTSLQTLNVNQQKWDALPDDLKAIVESACNAETLNVWRYQIEADVDALEYFDSVGVTVTQLSDDALNTLNDWASQYFEKHATPGTKMAEIRASQMAYIKKIAAYKDSMRMPYPAWAYEE